MNPTFYERFEIWSKYFHIGGNFPYKNQINHEGEGIMNSILVSSNSRPATYPIFPPISPHNHCDSPHVAHLKRERERECKCRVHWLEGVENSWLKHCAMKSNSFEVVFQYQILTSFKFHDIFPQFFCKGRIKKMKMFREIVN